MFYYRVTIAYKGTHYFGWQTQTADSLHEVKPTIEGTILNRLKKIANYQHCTISATSRTDAGVHAQGQIAKITLPMSINPEHLLMGLNSVLPDDIRILTCEPSSKSYQPSRSSIRKEYHYYFTTSPVAHAPIADIALHLPIDINQPDNMALLRSACQHVIGRHDFYNFSSRDKRVSNSIREVFHCDIHQANFSPLADNMYYLKIVGDGFLKHMVRYLMGALVDLAKGRISSDDIRIFLQQHQDHKLSPRADARGLHLMDIEEQT